jgi:hypothetical protein
MSSNQSRESPRLRSPSDSASDSTSDSTSQSQPSLPPHVARWRHKWGLFQRALRSRDEFDAWYWVCQLGAGMADYLYHSSRMNHLVHYLRLPILWRPLTPAIAIFLILFTLSSYFVSLRIHVLRHRWCPSVPSNSTVLGLHGTPGESCAWEHVHTTIVSYLGIMILYTFIGVIFESPGVVIPLLQNRDAPTDYRWQAIQSQGGFLGWDVTVDVAAERRRVEAYGSAIVLPQDDINYNASEYPTTNFSFCKKCDTWRPPRCHHCSICRRCVMQMDHHCPWFNNCIGYNNIRAFILSLTFLLLGCWYGASVLAMPFFELMEHQVAEHGWKLLYSHGTGFLDLPGPLELLSRILSGNLEPAVWIKIIFPLLTGVGIVLTVFWASHIKYVLAAQTTLENKIILTNMRTRAMDALRRSSSRHTIARPTNPFDQGWKQNALQIFGPNLLCLLLPFRLDSPPPPFVPKSKNNRCSSR